MRCKYVYKRREWKQDKDIKEGRKEKLENFGKIFVNSFFVSDICSLYDYFYSCVFDLRDFFYQFNRVSFLSSLSFLNES